MELCNGELVMYINAGVCRFERVEEKKFGKEVKKYAVLSPCGESKSVYYIPQEAADQKIRRLMSREKILSLIDSIPEIEPYDLGGKNERRDIFNTVLKSDDSRQLVALLKALHQRQQKRSADRKHLAVSEEAAMQRAEKLLYQEFAAVLGIDSSEVTGYISERLEESQQA